MKSSVSSLTNNFYKQGVVNKERLGKLGCNYWEAQGNEHSVKDSETVAELNRLRLMIKELQKSNQILKNSFEPFKEESGKLLVENNELYCKLTNQEAKYEREIKNLKKKAKEKEKEFSDLEFVYRHTADKVKELEKELLEKNNKILDLVGNKAVVIKSDGCKNIISGKFPVLEISEPLHLNLDKLDNKLWESKAQADDVKVFNMVEVLEKNAEELLKELEKLKVENHHQYEITASLKCQINQKEREIERLRRAFDVGRLPSSISKDFCVFCGQKEEKLKSLEDQLKVAVTKEHEAMSRALYLAERNQRLERELKDLDNMALAVEEECQNKVKQNLKNMDVLQEKLRQKTEEIKKLDETIADMTKKLEQDAREIENLKSEKKKLESNLNLATNEKKSLNDKLGHFLTIERTLTSEISRLQEANKNLQKKIVNMDERAMEGLGAIGKSRFKKKHKHPCCTGVLSAKTSSTSTSKLLKDENTFKDECFSTKPKPKPCEEIQEGRNFYYEEGQRLKKVLGSGNENVDDDSNMMRLLKDRNREIKELQEELHSVKKFECGDHLSCSSGDSIKLILDRLERERSKAFSDISRLQREKDALKEKLQTAMDCQLEAQSRFEKVMLDSDERIRRLECERRELISNFNAQRITSTKMEEKMEEFKEKAETAENNLTLMTTNYSQLKNLQEQTDRILSEIQTRLNQTEIELRFATNKIKELEKDREDLEIEVLNLKKEKSSLRSSLATLEKEKDCLLITLDEKTEKVAKFEIQAKKQEAYVSELQEKHSRLEKKFESTLKDRSIRQQDMKTLDEAVERLKEDLEDCERHNKTLIRENRHLQDDLACAVKENFLREKELNAERREVENLKKQLRQYVSEVKKAEELLSKKEIERTRLLDNFKSLSLEANALENDNHSLESTVENTKSELISANNRIMDLENEMSSKDSLLSSYENQIAELATQASEYETKLKEQTDLRIKAETDLITIKGLCSTIDSQKEAFKRQASLQEAEKTQLMNELRRLSEEYNCLNHKFSYEKSFAQTLEKSLVNSRKEALEYKMTNNDLQIQVQTLRQKVDELTQKLEPQNVRKYESQCADLSEQESELKKGVTKEEKEDSKRNSSLRDEEIQCQKYIEEEQPKSARNFDIPPLKFHADSDRTPSLDSGRQYASFREVGSRFREFDLSTLQENSENKSDASSVVSSLPEDSEPKAEVSKITISSPEDVSIYPTYSVQKRSDGKTDLCKEHKEKREICEFQKKSESDHFFECDGVSASEPCPINTGHFNLDENSEFQSCCED